MEMKKSYSNPESEELIVRMESNILSDPDGDKEKGEAGEVESFLPPQTRDMLIRGFHDVPGEDGAVEVVGHHGLE